MEYEQGQNIMLYVTFANQDGSPADVTSGIVTVSHKWGTGITTDIDRQLLTQLNGSTYYYDWNVPANADETAYNVRYVGVYSDGTVALGDETFQVIIRDFYSKKGGGLIQRTGKDIWTVSEKDDLIKIIDEIKKKSNSLDSINDNLSILPKSLDMISSKLESQNNLFDNTAKGNDIKLLNNSLYDGFTNMKSTIDKLDNEIILQQNKSDSYKDELIKLTTSEDAKLAEKFSISQNTLLALLTKINNLEADIRNERMGLVITGLEDLRHELDDFKNAFVVTLSDNLVEKIKNENQRIDKTGI